MAEGFVCSIDPFWKKNNGQPIPIFFDAFDACPSFSSGTSLVSELGARVRLFPRVPRLNLDCWLPSLQLWLLKFFYQIIRVICYKQSYG